MSSVLVFKKNEVPHTSLHLGLLLSRFFFVMKL